MYYKYTNGELFKIYFIKEMRIMSPVMVGYTQFLNFSFYDASVAFNYESFTFSGNSLKTYMETQQFYGNEK